MASLTAPRILIFDWHGTLVNTSDAMYRSMDDMLSALDRLGLNNRLANAAKCKSAEDRRLLEYVRSHRRLHPKIIADRRASRTDLLEILFGSDEQAKNTANRAYNGCYRNHYGDVKPFESGIRNALSELRELGIRLGILTNRSREFLDKELETIERGTWAPLFDGIVSGSDARQLKPSPAPVFRALQDFDSEPGADIWYIGDSTSDTVCAKAAGITSIFFNGAHGDAEWIETIFPGSAAYPHRPDYVVDNHRDLVRLVKDTVSSTR